MPKINALAFLVTDQNYSLALATMPGGLLLEVRLRGRHHGRRNPRRPPHLTKTLDTNTVSRVFLSRK